MAATSTAFAAATGSAAVASTSSRLSSGNAFRTTSMVQFAPLRSKRTNGVVAARAAFSEDSKSVGKEVLVSILAASTALGFGVAVVDGAFANPIDDAKAKTSTSLKSAQDAAPSLPSAPSPGGAVKDAQKSAEKLTSDVSGQIDGIFGKGKGGPLSSKASDIVASSAGGKGSAFADAQKRVSEFGKNPIADNIEGASKNAENIARATPKPSGERVEEATKNVEKIGSDAQSKGKEAVAEGKSFLNDKSQGSVPSLPSFPNVFPKPEGLPTPDLGKAKEGVDSKVEGVKKAVEGAFQ